MKEQKGTTELRCVGVAGEETLSFAWRLFNPGSTAVPLVMIMGWSGVKEDWRSLATDLAADRPVLVFDNRGSGASSVPPGPYSARRMAEDTAALVDSFGWHRHHLLGISMGGMIAQQYALQQGNRVVALVLGCTTAGGEGLHLGPANLMDLLAPAPGMRARDMAARVWRVSVTEEWIAEDPLRFDQLVDEALQWQRPIAGIMGQAMAVGRHRLGDKVAEIGVPVLIVHGDSDQLLPMANGDYLAAHISGAEMIRLAGVGHMFWLMRPQVAAKIGQFLAEHETASPLNP